MAFQPRTTRPDDNDLNWIHTSYGGKNLCIWIQGRSVLPNCTGYAWGRFMEILGKSPTLSRANAGDWFAYTSDGYQRGQDPQLGAVICWGKYGGAGHVAVVEEIKEDGSIVTSESGYQTPAYWWTTHRHRGADNNWGQSSSYYFQGFIYNPESKGSSCQKEFIDFATKHIGENKDWTYKTLKLSGNVGWSGAFISACAQSVKGVSEVIPPYSTGSLIIKLGVTWKMGEWVPGPGQGKSSSPKIGDLLAVRYQSYTDEHKCDRIGIVVAIHATGIQTIEGDVNGKVSYKHYAHSDKTVSGYYRPNWVKATQSKLPGGTSNGDPNYIPTSLYDYQNTREDLTIRETGFLNTDLEPSIHASDIRLSAVNYTTLLGALYKLLAPKSTGFVPSGSDGSDTNTDRLEGSAKTVVDFLLKKGLSGAGACGIAGNIYHESSFNTAAVGDYGTSFGICQWHYSRGDAMKAMAGPNWASNLSGQLDYLWYELTTSEYTSMMSRIRSQPNTIEGCKRVADIFMREFERPADQDIKTIQRQATASEYFNQLVIQK